MTFFFFFKEFQHITSVLDNNSLSLSFVQFLFPLELFALQFMKTEHP